MTTQPQPSAPRCVAGGWRASTLLYPHHAGCSRRLPAATAGEASAPQHGRAAAPEAIAARHHGRAGNYRAMQRPGLHVAARRTDAVLAMAGAAVVVIGVSADGL